MNQQTFFALELHKVLLYLAAFTVSEPGEDAALALSPSGDPLDLSLQLALFDEGRLWMEINQPRLDPFPDLKFFWADLERPHTILDLDALHVLRQFLQSGCILLHSLLGSGAEKQWPSWLYRCQSVLEPVKTLAALKRCLSEDGLLRDEASPELFLARRELRRLHQQCIRRVKEFAVEYNIIPYLQDDFMTIASDRYVLPIKTSYKNKLQGVIHDYSQTGETCYFEPLFLVEVNNRLQELKKEERKEEIKVCRFLTALAQEEFPGIRAVYALMIELDLLFAKVRLAQCYSGRIAAMADNNSLSLIEAKHPLLALAESLDAQRALTAFAHLKSSREDFKWQNELFSLLKKRRDRASVVPATLELVKEQRGLLISGGNAGGKTVCLKTLGLIALMSRCVLPVPVAPGSVMPLWIQCHAFIGDEQSLEDHVSTFTAQITHLAKIWPHLGQHSLVILDEFAVGTDPAQGAALAQAVIACLLEKGVFLATATHFPSLKAYALSEPQIRTASVLFDPRSKKPLFRLAYDQVGASHALDVAKEHGLPEFIVRRAEQYLLLSPGDSEEQIERLNALALERELALHALRQEKESYAQQRMQLAENFTKEKNKFLQGLQKEYQAILRDLQQNKISHRQALKGLGQIRQVAYSCDEQPANGSEGKMTDVDLAVCQPGRELWHLPWKRLGTILELDEKRKRVRLDLAGVSLWADLKDLRLHSGSGEKKAQAVSVPLSQGPQAPISSMADRQAGVSAYLDLRGLRADAALSKLAHFLDTAVLNGYYSVELIHGRGTGALRREVHAFLADFPLVSAFSLAPEAQGGDGATLVELK